MDGESFSREGLPYLVYTEIITFLVQLIMMLLVLVFIPVFLGLYVFFRLTSANDESDSHFR